MLSAVDPVREEQRLGAVYRTGLLDTPPEPEFDELAKIAAAICGVQQSVVSIIDERRQWFKAAWGFPLPEVDRNLTFCQHTIKQDKLVEIEDARSNPLVRNNPFVTPKDGVRFYAGMPVQSPDGHNIGTLCVFDNKPHVLNDTQRNALVMLASQANARIELRMQRIELQQALREAEEAKAKAEASDKRFKAFMNAGPFLSVMKDSDGRLLYYNQQFSDHFKLDGGNWLFRSNYERFSAKRAAVTNAHDHLVLSTRKPKVFLEESENTDGTISQWRSYKFPVDDADGSPMLGVIAVEVTEELARQEELRKSREELEVLNARLEKLATTDPLTGMPNRRVFDERLQLEFARARRKKTELAVIMIDVDNFKRCNDSHGHDYGDRVLQQLAGVLRNSVRETDLAARYGGEEFVVLLPEADETQALEKANAIVEGMHCEEWLHEPCTVSIGVAALEPWTSDGHRLVTLADDALYAAKKSGKDRAVGHAKHAELRG